MPRYEITLEKPTAEFYARIAAQANRSLEQVLSDALFKLAGELAMEALSEQRH